MLIRYSVKNFRTFRDETVLSMVASKQTTYNDRLLRADGLRVLPSAAIYGANASGKSNLIKSLALFREIVCTGTLKNSDVEFRILPLYPFMFSKKNTEIELAAEFIQKDGAHYGYALAFDADKQIFVREKLDVFDGKTPLNIFIRENNAIQINMNKKVLSLLKMNEIFLQDIQDRINQNLDASELFLTRGFKGVVCTEIADQVVGFFTDELFVVSDFSSRHYNFEIGAADLPKKEITIRAKLLSDFVKMADFGSQDISIRTSEDKENPDSAKMRFISSYKFDGSDNPNQRVFILSELVESTGTMKLINLVFPLVNALVTGGVMVLDEFDALLHPELTKGVLILFNDPEINKNGAQLIFTTHNPIFLNNKIFRRDQIFFVEKDETDYSSSLYSLADFGSEEVRNDENYLINYFKGKYGALPFADFSALLKKERDGDV